MLLVKTKLKESSLGGLGLFADEFIPKGTRVWQNGTDSELFLTQVEFGVASVYLQELIRHYGYFDKKDFVWKLPLDNARFMNHSEKPNLGQDEEGNNYALEEIFPNDELTCDYRLFEPEEHREFLKS